MEYLIQHSSHIIYIIAWLAWIAYCIQDGFTHGRLYHKLNKETTHFIWNWDEHNIYTIERGIVAMLYTFLVIALLKIQGHTNHLYLLLAGLANAIATASVFPFLHNGMYYQTRHDFAQAHNEWLRKNNTEGRQIMEMRDPYPKGFFDQSTTTTKTVFWTRVMTPTTRTIFAVVGLAIFIFYKTQL